MTILRFAILAGLLVWPAAGAWADEATEARQALEAFELRVRGNHVGLVAEAQFGRGLQTARKAGMSLAKLTRATKRHKKMQRDDTAEIARLRKLWVRRNIELARIRNGDVVGNNRIAGELNAIKGQMDLLQAQVGVRREQMDEDYIAAAEARDVYLESVRQMRALADEISAVYEQMAADPAVQGAVERLNRAQERVYTLALSSTFQSGVRRLEQLEASVQSGSIQLRRGSGVMFATVVLNGTYTQEMMVDSGASFISLPAHLAEKIGVKVTDTDRTITLQLADGRLIPGKLVVLESVRVGEFEVRDVECAVLGPEVPKADALLGMSFLGRFEFRVDPQAATLTLERVELSSSPSSRK